MRQPETVRDVGIRPPAGIVDRQIRKGLDPRSQVSVVFTGPFQNTQTNRIILRAMAETLEGNLQRTLREDLGGTYGVSVSPDFQQRPRGSYRVTISFACDPARLNALVERAVPRDRSVPAHRPVAGAGGGRTAGAGAGSGNEQPQQLRTC